MHLNYFQTSKASLNRRGQMRSNQKVSLGSVLGLCSVGGYSDETYFHLTLLLSRTES